jgi:hypothetical protein
VDGALLPGSTLAPHLSRNELTSPRAWLAFGTAPLPASMPAGVPLWLQAWFEPTGAATEFAVTTTVAGLTQ